ncbi:MAG TPA: TolB protein [Mariprofundaceae bacterium]|nr:TolB protein [Mariprofundaceae bacterium]
MKMMNQIKVLFFTGALLAAPAAYAENLLDWLESASKSSSTKQAEVPADSAVLLTLEPKESEMYPKISADGKHLIVLASQGKDGLISRRAAENGDPLNVVTDDVRALDSARWHGDSVTFFSERAGGLGLWVRSPDGQGVVRRAKELNGQFTQPLLLDDGSVIAVRLEATEKRKSSFQRKHDDFNNWEIRGFRSEIVRIDEHGAERVLSQGTNPSLSPDGQWIAFSMSVGRSYHLYMMKVDGSDLTQLTDERSVDVQPVWSRDGKWIVFTSNRALADMRKPKNNNWDIWAIDREGRNLTQLTMDEARDGAPSVAANGRVYFHSDRKVTREMKDARNIKGRVGQFHIWSISMAK